MEPSNDAPTWRITMKFTDGMPRSWKVSRQIKCRDPWRAQRIASYLARRAHRGRSWLAISVDAPRLVAGEFRDYDWSKVA